MVRQCAWLLRPQLAQVEVGERGEVGHDLSVGRARPRHLAGSPGRGVGSGCSGRQPKNRQDNNRRTQLRWIRPLLIILQFSKTDHTDQSCAIHVVQYAVRRTYQCDIRVAIASDGNIVNKKVEMVAARRCPGALLARPPPFRTLSSGGSSTASSPKQSPALEQWPWAVKPFPCTPVYVVGGSPYKTNRAV